METQSFVVSSSLSFLHPNTHKMMLSDFLYYRGGFRHIGAQTASLIPYFRMDIIKVAC